MASVFYPVDVLRSEFLCTIEMKHKQKIVRLGLNYVRDLRRETALAIIAARHQQSFTSMEDLQRRVPQLNKKKRRPLRRVSEHLTAYRATRPTGIGAARFGKRVQRCDQPGHY